MKHETYFGDEHVHPSINLSSLGVKRSSQMNPTAEKASEKGYKKPFLCHRHVSWLVAEILSK